MNYKLKHLSRFCCNPANELEFEAVKMAAELGRVDHGNLDYFNKFPLVGCFFNEYDEAEKITQLLIEYKEEFELIPTLDFCNKLRMTEEEARELEDDRVDISLNSSALCDFMREERLTIKQAELICIGFYNDLVSHLESGLSTELFYGEMSFKKNLEKALK